MVFDFVDKFLGKSSAHVKTAGAGFYHCAVRSDAVGKLRSVGSFGAHLNNRAVAGRYLLHLSEAYHFHKLFPIFLD